MSADALARLFRQEVRFIAGAARISQIPKLIIPEIAFVGKSNVGKSTLINSICNRRHLARVSHTPGRTQQINFFQLADKFILVDLPGYGFAKVPGRIKREWEKLIVHYLSTRENLRLVNLLIDARHGIKPPDMEVARLLLLQHRDFQVVFTKADKAESIDEIIKDCENFLATLGYSCNVILTSSRSKMGAKELQLSMSRHIKY